MENLITIIILFYCLHFFTCLYINNSTFLNIYVIVIMVNNNEES